MKEFDTCKEYTDYIKEKIGDFQYDEWESQLRYDVECIIDENCTFMDKNMLRGLQDEVGQCIVDHLEKMDTLIGELKVDIDFN